ncbi:class I SAM-dependent methyltransferase [Polyangium sp. 15x6]|uniref:class I SAM-dependent methyltransferase n=1 Tax=Polyangium sp. 15x6 TaxID=3042687 RepID=UPI00249B0D84|nr:class I SAM-dependent methyltransferase [Polyangium sp. 15x6]MDI3289068.1 class I SAM-dependent methyltransferase [Polyangium sp. 15x6]
MGSQYDTLAAVTNLTAEMPLRKFYEEHTFFQALGDITGRSVLDVACGTGLYSRRFKQRGAARVVGIDNSEGMVDYARHLEGSQPLGIEYHVQGAENARGLGTFDVVAATYLLHYAPSQDVLRDMCTSLHASLAPGGRLVSICMSPDIELRDTSYYRKYGFEAASRGEEGDVATVKSLVPEAPFTLSAYHWKRATYEAVLREAGFRNIVWHPPEVAPEGVAALGADYWSEYLRRPHAEIFSCTK